MTDAKGSKNFLASSHVVTPGVIPHQHGKRHPALFQYRSSAKDSRSSRTRVGLGVTVAVGDGLGVFTGSEVGVILGSELGVCSNKTGSPDGVVEHDPRKMRISTVIERNLNFGSTLLFSRMCLLHIDGRIDNYPFVPKATYPLYRKTTATCVLR